MIKPNYVQMLMDLNDIEFRSRDEARCANWLRQMKMENEYEPRSIQGNDEIWTPDFYLPQINTYLEVKPLQFWHETKRVKRVTWWAVARGERFWVWIVFIHKFQVVIGEMTAPRESENEEKQMQVFEKCGDLAEIHLPMVS